MKNDLLKRLLMCVPLLVCMVCIPCSAIGANVSVYAEGAYTNNDLEIYIYADITNGPILSFGVRVEYPSTLTYVEATKNESVWYFGDGSSEFSYMDPEPDGSGVVIIGGKLDTSNPTEGVEGSRVLLGTVKFSHSGVTDFSTVSVTYGRGTGAESDTFKNFVDVDGGIVDGGVTFGTEIHERGDVNADGKINIADFLALKTSFGSDAFSCWADCNEDEQITVGDFLCLKTKFQ